jgi:hypothetical protein
VRGGDGARSERDSSGTTEADAKRTYGARAAAKVMERIARREPRRGEAARKIQLKIKN